MQLAHLLSEIDATGSRGFWLMPIVFGVLAAIRFVALGSTVQVSGDRLIFKASLLHRLVILLGSSGAFAVVIATWHGSETWERTALILIALGISAGLPAEIVLDANGVRRKLWWRPVVLIPWPDVIAVQQNTAGDWIVYGKRQDPITFSRFNVAAQRFKAEVIARAHLPPRSG